MNLVGKIEESRLPNGGWGWMVVLGVALTNMFNHSLVSVFGLLFGGELEEMGYGTSGVTLVANLNNMVMCFSGLLIGPLLKNYSCRKVAFVGTLLTSFGIIMSSFAKSIVELIIFYSFFTGIGLGLIYPSTFVAIKSYFTTKRGTAVGFSMAGTGIGQMLVPQLVQYLLDEYGYLWTTRIIGALCLHGIAGSLLFQPVEWHLKDDVTEKNTSHLLIDNCALKNGNKNPKPEQIICSRKYTIDIKLETPLAKQPGGKVKESMWKTMMEQLDLKLLKDAVFLNIASGLSLAYTAGMTFSVVYPFLLQDSVGLDRVDTALCMSSLSAMDIIARVTLPAITQLLKIANRTTFMFGVLALAVARLVIAEQHTLNSLIVASLVCGYIRAASVINQNLTVSDYCSDDKLPAALGLVMVSKGLFVMTIGQLFGWLRDYTKSYPLCIHATNLLLVIIFVSWGVEMIIAKIKDANTTED